MVFVSILAKQSSATIEPEAILGIWILDESKSGVATYSSKNGRDGKITGSLKVVKAKFNQGFEFEGKLNNYVSVPHNKSKSRKGHHNSLVPETAGQHIVICHLTLSLVFTAYLNWLVRYSGGISSLVKFAYRWSGLRLYKQHINWVESGTHY